jgi:hypothetical protein
MALALKFVKVSVALPDKASFPAALYGSPHINTSLRASRAKTPASFKDDIQGFFGLDQTRRQLAVLNQLRTPLASTKRRTRRICK